MSGSVWDLEARWWRRRSERTPMVLLAQLYPPGIGGTAVLFENVYARLQDRFDVTVVTDRKSCAGSEAYRGRVRMVRTDIDLRLRGVRTRPEVVQHALLARLLHGTPGHARALVHTARAAPEGIAAWLASRSPRAPGYMVWAHGEEIGTGSKSREFLAVMKVVYRGARVVLANSHNTERMLRAIGVAPEQVRVVHPGVDVTRFHPRVDGGAVRARHVREGERLILCAGRLQARKGQDRLIASLARIPDRDRVRLLLVGTGPDAERERLELVAREAGVRDRVTFAGAVTSDELPQYFAACDVFCMPNRDDHGDVEGFGIVYLEASAAGRAAIGGRSGGVPEAIEEGVSGLLVDGDDPDAIAAGLGDLLRNEARRTHLGEQGRRRVLRSFTWEHAAEKVAQLHLALTTHLDDEPDD